MSDWRCWRDLCESINARTMPSYLFDEKYGKAPIGPNGRRLCKWCGGEVPRGRRTICSKECQSEINMRISPNIARWHVEQRDHGICAHCGIDTNAVGDAAIFMDQGDRKRRYGESTTYSRFLLAHNLHRDHLWEMHHKTAIAEGGHLCGIDGYITLCVWCHGRETAALARRRAKARKMGKPERTLFE